MKLEAIVNGIREAPLRGAVYAIDKYNQAYERYPRLTNYISTAVGTVGGDAIAKRFAEGQDIKLRDVAFTAGAALYQSFLYPKVVDWTNKALENEKVGKVFKKFGINKKWAKAITMTGMFFPLNMAYWGILSVKNQIPINLRSLGKGARTIVETSVPYLAVDYYVANKAKKKHALPIWSGAELAWNAYFALRNYLTK